MVKARTWFTLFMVSVGTVAATASCSSDEATGGAGGGGSIISGGGHAGTAGRTGSGGGPAISSSIGIECTADADCGGKGLVCAKANSTVFGNGGPSGGMCTLPCTPTQDGTGTECQTLSATALCIPFGDETDPQAYCLDGCVLGDDPLDVSTKCAGRPDFVCYQSSALPSALCVPHCRSDAECGTGLYCDQSSPLGLCVKTKPVGDPVGTPCDADINAPQTCAGVCLGVSSDTTDGVCAELCATGSECMYGPGSKPSPGGFCAGALSDAPGLLDLGYCLPNCSCSSDCKFPGDLCRAWPSDFSDVADALGAPGVCYPIVAGSVELSCSEGGAGGAGGASGAGGAGGDATVTPVGGAAGASGSN
ncbi:MAG TPA: hypothetical protein VGC79_34905 [Polyangiaceae bacterium]